MNRRSAIVTAAVLVMSVVSCVPAARAQATDRWAKEMAAFEDQDRKSPPKPGGIVFVGSSSIRLWDLAKWFPGLPAVNRGFGGSEIADSVRHADLLVIRHKPRIVVFYAGDNDINNKKTPQAVADDYKAFVTKVHAALPDTKIVYIAIKPSIQRWAIVGRMREANALIRAFAETDDRLGYLDIDGPMLGWDERPRKELFVDDGLHLSDRGYELWTTLVRPFLQ